MPHDRALYQWTDRLATHFPELPEPQRRWLAMASYGIALARCAAVSAVALKLSILFGLALGTARQQIRELYQPAGVKPGGRHQQLDYTACFAPLLRWAAADAHGRRPAAAPRTR